MNTSGVIKKFSVLVAFLTMLLPSAALASFYDEEDSDPGVIPDDPAAIVNAICANNPSICAPPGDNQPSTPIIIHDENGDVALVPNINVDPNVGNSNNNPPPSNDNPPPSDNNSPPPSNNDSAPPEEQASAGNDSAPQEEQVSSGNDSAPQQDIVAPVTSQVLAQDPTKKPVLGPTILTQTTVSSILIDTIKQPDVVGFSGDKNGSPQVVVQLANPSASPAANQTKAVDVLDNLSTQLKDSKVAVSTTKSPIIADIVTSKTNAFSTSSAFVVAQSAFVPGSNTLTPEASQLFSSIQLKSNNVVTVVGNGPQAAVLVKELQNNGVSKDQIKVLATEGVDSKTLAVSIETLPMLPDIFNMP